MQRHGELISKRVIRNPRVGLSVLLLMCGIELQVYSEFSCAFYIRAQHILYYPPTPVVGIFFHLRIIFRPTVIVHLAQLNLRGSISILYACVSFAVSA